MRKLVSIVIPCFNQAQYLRACVDRCLFQTWAPLEIIVVDGGSSDGTWEIVKDIEGALARDTIESVSHMDDRGEIVRITEKRYPQGRDLKTISFPEDIGATRTYNEGLSRARGEYVTYIVGDDLPHPHMIEELVSALETSDADFVYSDMDVVDDAGSVIRQIRKPDYSFKSCLADWYHLGVSHLYRRKLHDLAGLMDQEGYRSANDYDHYLRFAMAGARFMHLPKILYSVRYHGKSRRTGQHTPENHSNLMEESRRCALRARKWLQEKNIKTP